MQYPLFDNTERFCVPSTLFKIFSIIFFASLLYGCGGSSSSSTQAHDPLTSIEIKQMTHSIIAGPSGENEELLDSYITFKAYGHYDNTDEVKDITSEVTWKTSSCNVICWTGTSAEYHASGTGEAEVYATIYRVNNAPAESEHINISVIDIQPYEIKLIKTQRVRLGDEIPRGLSTAYKAELYWNDGRITDGTNVVQWNEEGDGFEAYQNEPNRFLATGQAGEISDISAKYVDFGIVSDEANLAVSSAQLESLEITASSSLEVPRGQSRLFEANATFIGDIDIGGQDSDTFTEDVTNDVVWKSSDTTKFVADNIDKQNAFHAVGDTGGYSSISPTMPAYTGDASTSNDIALTISDAVLMSLEIKTKNGASTDVPKFFSRELEVIGTFSGDVSKGESTFNEDVTDSVIWNDDKCSGIFEEANSPNIFSAIGMPAKFCDISVNYGNETSNPITLTVVYGEVDPGSLVMERRDPEYSDDIPKEQRRYYIAKATFGGTEYDVTSDVTWDSDSPSNVFAEGDHVTAIGILGSTATIKATLQPTETETETESSINNVLLTVKAQHTDEIKIDGVTFLSPPEDKMSFVHAEEYCNNLSAEISTYNDLQKLVNQYVGPNHGWSYGAEDSFDFYWVPNDGSLPAIVDGLWVELINGGLYLPPDNYEDTAYVTCVLR